MDGFQSTWNSWRSLLCEEGNNWGEPSLTSSFLTFPCCGTGRVASFAPKFVLTLEAEDEWLHGSWMPQCGLSQGKELHAESQRLAEICLWVLSAVLTSTCKWEKLRHRGKNSIRENNNSWRSGQILKSEDLLTTHSLSFWSCLIILEIKNPKDYDICKCTREQSSRAFIDMKIFGTGQNKIHKI